MTEEKLDAVTGEPSTPERRRLDAYLARDVGSDLAVLGMSAATADGDAPKAIEAAVTKWHSELADLLVGMARELRALGATDDEIHKWKGRTLEGYFDGVGRPRGATLSRPCRRLVRHDVARRGMSPVD